MQLGVAWLHGPIRVMDTLNGRPLETMGGPGEWGLRVARYMPGTCPDAGFWIKMHQEGE